MPSISTQTFSFEKAPEIRKYVSHGIAMIAMCKRHYPLLVIMCVRLYFFIEIFIPSTLKNCCCYKKNRDRPLDDLHRQSFFSTSWNCFSTQFEVGHFELFILNDDRFDATAERFVTFWLHTVWDATEVERLFSGICS